MAAKDVPSVFSVKKDESTEQNMPLQTRQLGNILRLMNNQTAQIQQLENLIHGGTAQVSYIQPARQFSKGRGGGSVATSGQAQNNERFRLPPPNNLSQQNLMQRQRSSSLNRGPNSGPSTSNTINNKRFPNPVYANRLDFCFYHRTFGRDAKNHEQPCAWVFPPKPK